MVSAGISASDSSSIVTATGTGFGGGSMMAISSSSSAMASGSSVLGGIIDDDFRDGSEGETRKVPALGSRWFESTKGAGGRGAVTTGRTMSSIQMMSSSSSDSTEDEGPAGPGASSAMGVV